MERSNHRQRRFAAGRSLARHRLRPITWLALVAACLYVTRASWLPLIGQALIISDPLQHADAVLPLAGDMSRVPYSVQLFVASAADWLLLTNDDPNPQALAQKRAEAEATGVPADRIVVVPGIATTTYDESVRIRKLAQARGWHSLVVVTSPYHTRRARIILREVFSSTSIMVSVVPVEPSWYRAEDWWQYPTSRAMTLLEYVKLVAYWTGYC